MTQGFRPDRIADQIRAEMAAIITREMHDPGLGFTTLTRVRVTADLQLARVYYTTLGDEQARRNAARAFRRAAPFLRHQIGRRLRLRRVPELEFVFDESIEGLDRLERILQDIHSSDAEPPSGTAAARTDTDDDRNGE